MSFMPADEEGRSPDITAGSIWLRLRAYLIKMLAGRSTIVINARISGKTGVTIRHNERAIVMCTMVTDIEGAAFTMEAS